MSISVSWSPRRRPQMSRKIFSVLSALIKINSRNRWTLLVFPSISILLFFPAACPLSHHRVLRASRRVLWITSNPFLLKHVGRQCGLTGEQRMYRQRTTMYSTKPPSTLPFVACNFLPCVFFFSLYALSCSSHWQWSYQLLVDSSDEQRQNTDCILLLATQIFWMYTMQI